ncbi:MAG: chromosome segregation protein SMC [Deltaproteobacteria bacterium]|nr:chromosome segregation protein SMC [Deltaproteobacteria bacterium]
MRIKQVDICGFKSFYDETKVVFDHAVTAVVGPNGCGKSNIVDAIRWALGEQSAKNLRGKGMEDVIFNGSETRGPKSMAEVTITFDNTDGLSHPEFVGYSEVSTTRRLHRDGTSEYFINKVPCRLMDVTDLFLGTGAGARAYSIIEQGRIGLIVSSRSEDRRAMIEEAAGITKYKASRRSAERRMEQTRQNLARVTDIVGEIERNLASLKRQAKKAERYKVYSAERLDLEMYLASHRYLELRARAMAVAAALSESEDIQQEARGGLTALEAEVEVSRLDEQAVKGQADEARGAAYEIDNAIQVLENEARHLGDALTRLAKEQAALTEQETAVEAQGRSLEGDLESVAAEVAALDADRASVVERHARMAAAAEEARAGLQSLTATQEEKKDQAGRSRARLAASEGAVTNLGRRIGEAEDRLKTALTEDEGLDARARELALAVDGIDGRTASVEGALCTARTIEQSEREAFNRLREEIDACDGERRCTRDELHSKASRLASLEEMHRGLERHDRGVREAVVTLRDEHDPALLSLLVDEVECPAHLEVALAAALGDRLEALIVKDRAAGLAILEKLKARDLGRVTVLARTAGKASQATPPTDPRVVGALGDFVKAADEATAELVSRLLDGVFVVEHLTDAMALWEATGGEAAFVTLDGQLIEADGVMRGGRSRSPEADLLVQKREIRELAGEVERLHGRHDALEERFNALKEELGARREAAERALREAQEHAIQLAEARKDRARAADELAAVVRRKEALAVEISSHEEVLAEARADLAEMSLAVSEATAEAAALEAWLAEHAPAIEALRAETDRLAAATADLRVEQAALEQQVGAAIARRENIAKSLAEVRSRLEGIRRDRCRVADETGRAAGDLVRHRDVLLGRLAESKMARARVTECQERLEAVALRLVEGEHGLKERRRQVDAIAEKVAALRLDANQVEIETGHLVEGVFERHRIDLPRVLGDYHLRPLPGPDVKARIDELRGLIDRMGPINLGAIEEFEREEERYSVLTVQKADLEQALEDLERAIARMDKDSRRRFKETFEDVNARFKDIFPKLFRGGRAELMLTDPEDLLASGVDIVAQPPGKRLGNIELMSGGEKALTAVSLLFAIFGHRPSPFCLLDEVDAPLDEANIGRFVDMVRGMTDRSQFIIITHSKVTMEKSDTLYGVTMEEAGVSKMISVRLAPRLAVAASA